MDRATGSSYPAVRPNDVSAYPVRVPPIAEQERIVEIVSSMDDVIQATEQAIAEAKVLRTTLLNQEIS
jgi:restriction endonuclease S subunit